MTDQLTETSGDDPGTNPSPPTPRPEKRMRRTMLSTGFGNVPGKICDVCDFQGFRWQTQCPQGHPLA